MPPTKKRFMLNDDQWLRLADKVNALNDEKNQVKKARLDKTLKKQQDLENKQALKDRHKKQALEDMKGKLRQERKGRISRNTNKNEERKEKSEKRGEKRVRFAQD